MILRPRITIADDKKKRSRKNRENDKYAITQSCNSLQRVKQHDIGSV